MLNENISEAWNNFELVTHETDIVKKYFTRYSSVLKYEFNNTIEESITKMESYSSQNILHLGFKAIVIMQKNWARSIDELDKLYSAETLIESSTLNNSYQLSADEIELTKGLIIQHEKFFREEFENNIEELKVQISIFGLNSKEKAPLLLKAIIMMKENGAKSIDEIDKLHNTTMYKRYMEIKEESLQQHKKDLHKASLLSQKIKNYQED